MVDVPPPRLLLRSTAIDRGLSDGELARAVRRHELHPLQRGAYLEEAVAAGTARDRAVIVATASGLRVPSVVSHASAAVLHQLPLWRVPLPKVHVTRQPPAAGSGSSRVHLHIALLPDDQVCLIDGLAVTDVARTVVDVARSVPFEPAVCVADAALRRRSCTPEQLRGSSTGWARCPVRGERRGSSLSPTAAATASGRAGAEWPSTVPGCPHPACSAASSGRTAR